jgi:hypothetical protein
MALAGLTAFQLPTGSEFKALFRAAFCFELGHFSSLKINNLIDTTHRP